MSPLVLYILLKIVGFTPPIATTMVCVAYHESKWDPNAVYVNDNGFKDIGLFQISTRHWVGVKDGCGMSEKRLLDPVSNIECAHHVYKKQGLRAWVAYKKHKKECDNYTLPLRN